MYPNVLTGFKSLYFEKFEAIETQICLFFSTKSHSQSESGILIQTCPNIVRAQHKGHKPQPSPDCLPFFPLQAPFCTVRASTHTHMHVQMHMHTPAHQHVSTHACIDISAQSPRSARALSLEPSPLALPSDIGVSHYIVQAGRVQLEMRSRQALKAKDYLGRKFRVSGTWIMIQKLVLELWVGTSP